MTGRVRPPHSFRGFETQVRMRSLAAATTLAVLFSSAALTATPAFADSVRPVSALEDAADTVVDGTHQRVFISDPSTNQIAVTDGTGAVVGALTGLPQVRDLTLSPDDSTLYAAVYGADKIVAFDTATLAQTAEYATGAGTIPPMSPTPTASCGSATATSGTPGSAWST